MDDLDRLALVKLDLDAHPAAQVMVGVDDFGLDGLFAVHAVFLVCGDGDCMNALFWRKAKH